MHEKLPSMQRVHSGPAVPQICPAFTNSVDTGQSDSEYLKKRTDLDVVVVVQIFTLPGTGGT